ncbi:unnamed protein product, partial [Adineta ricciae]
MCHYCAYLAHVKSSTSSSQNSYSLNYYQQRQARSYNLTVPFCLVSLTLFFVLLNITLVLSQSSQVQQQRDQSSNKILEGNSRDVFGVNTNLDEDQTQAKYRQYLTTTMKNNNNNANGSLHQPKTKRLTFEKRLIRDLLDNYPTIYARPIRNVSETLIISFGLTLTQLFDLGSTGQKMQTNTWKTLKWQDMNLVWDPDRYGGLKTVCLPADSIWTPDVVLDNYADERLKDWREISAVIQHTGDILYVPATMQFSVCFLD